MQAVAQSMLCRVGQLNVQRFITARNPHTCDVKGKSKASACHCDSRMSYLLEWTRQQQELRLHVISQDDTDWSWHQDAGKLECIGGVDISFFKQKTDHGTAVEADRETEQGVAALVVLTFPDMKLVYSDTQVLPLGAPYIPGYLGFREVPAYMELIERLRQHDGGRLVPQVILVDGCGMLHPQQFGSACHLGVVSGIPTVGVAKNLLVVDGLDRLVVEQQILDKRATLQQQRQNDALPPQQEQEQEQEVPLSDTTAASGTRPQTTTEVSVPIGTFDGSDQVPGMLMVPPEGTTTQSLTHNDVIADDVSLPALEHELNIAAGEHHTVLPLVGASGKVWGAALCSSTSKKPLYISVGHRVGLVTAVQLVSKCCSHRVPEPTRQADLISRQAARDITAGLKS